MHCCYSRPSLGDGLCSEKVQRISKYILLNLIQNFAPESNLSGIIKLAAYYITSIFILQVTNQCPLSYHIQKNAHKKRNLIKFI